MNTVDLWKAAKEACGLERAPCTFLAQEQSSKLVAKKNETCRNWRPKGNPRGRTDSKQGRVDPRNVDDAACHKGANGKPDECMLISAQT